MQAICWYYGSQRNNKICWPKTQISNPKHHRNLIDILRCFHSHRYHLFTHSVMAPVLLRSKLSLQIWFGSTHFHSQEKHLSRAYKFWFSSPRSLDALSIAAVCTTYILCSPLCDGWIFSAEVRFHGVCCWMFDAFSRPVKCNWQKKFIETNFEHYSLLFRQLARSMVFGWWCEGPPFFHCAIRAYYRQL